MPGGHATQTPSRPSHPGGQLLAVPAPADRIFLMGEQSGMNLLIFQSTRLPEQM
jgi:hypothetical protein